MRETNKLNLEKMSTKRPFNTSNKDPLSTKLRNFNASKSATRQLEVDSRRMEERLRELKMTISQEKQERVRQGSGGFWRSGKEGALTTHVPKSGKNRNNTEMPRPSKPKKITVLKDGPIKVPKRTQKPTLNLTARKTFEGPACGQCEEKAAALSCMECGELYCAGCFAAFHLKGALKLHRSVPYQAGQELRRSLNSPANVMNSNETMGHPQDTTQRSLMSTHQQKPLVSTTHEQSLNGYSLLDGEYNEEESSASFAAALAEWRGQPKVTSKPSSSTRHNKAEVSTVNEGTGTEQVPKQEIKIEFKELSMSYADKLLLKKHRRTELPQMPTPRLDEDRNSRILMPSAGPSEELHNNNNTSNDFFVDEDPDEEELKLQEEHLRYASLFSTSSSALSNCDSRCKSVVTITPLPDNIDNTVIEEEMSYLVQEESDDEPVLCTAQQFQTTAARNNCQSSKSQEVSGKSEKKKTIKNQQTKSVSCGKKETITDEQRLLPRPPSEQSRRKKNENEITNDQKKHLLENDKVGKEDSNIPDVKKRTSSRNRKLIPSSKVTRKENVQKERSDVQCKDTKVVSNKKSTPTRAASAQNQRHASGRTSKGDGRASRSGKRAASAGITRQPSEELAKASKLAWKSQHQYKHGLNEFFMAGLGGQEPVSAEPMLEHSNTASLPTCSFQGPGYWRPDSSLSTADVSYTTVTPFNAEDHQKSQSTISWKLSQDLPKGESITPTQNLSDSTNNLERTPPDGRDSRPKSCIEIEGDDFSLYDENLDLEREVEADDEDTLQQLTSELESRMDSEMDGPMSRLSMLEEFPDGEYEDQLGIEQDNGLGSGLSTPCDELDIEQEMDEESMMADFEEEERIASVMEVNALQ